jgi:ADP-ribosylglycohydrolase/protein-tyrosine phosphatase
MSRGPIPHSYWVHEGSLLAGEYPLEMRTFGDKSKVLKKLLQAGIDCFLNLTGPKECPDYESLLPPGVLHIRKSLTDHGLPSRPEQMQDIQSTVAAQLAAGRRVYVHCRAGIGRTGTVIGCYLVEQGHGGEEALAELNRLWQQNALSKSWPEVPETDEQSAYVREWPQHRRAQTMLPSGGVAAPAPPAMPERSPAATSSSARVAASANTGHVRAVDESEVELRLVASLRDRFQGAMTGLAIGDALAAATQFRRRGSFSAVGDLLGGGPYDLPRGAWSDDTAMALCVAESLVERGAFDSRDLLERLVRWQSEGHLSATGQCVGITSTVARALAMSQWRRGAPAGSHDPAQRDPEALSRIAPAVLYAFHDEAQAVDIAAESARMTCQSPVVIDACRLLAAMLHAALRGEPRARVLVPSQTVFATQPLKHEVATIAMAAPKSGAFEGKDPAGADVLGALRAARWALATTTSFRDGALAAVNLGGHSDVIGAVYGQLAGAFYGAQGIPAHWRTALVRQELVAGLADRMLADALVALGGTTASA